MFRRKDGKIKDDEKVYIRTDLDGKITLANNAFFKLSGFSRDELIGNRHHLVRHPLMPAVIYTVLWKKLKKDETVIVFFRNITKSKKEYWLLSEISPYIEHGEKVGYVSQGVTPAREAIKELRKLYDLLIQREKKENLIKSADVLKNFLKGREMTYNQYMGYLLQKKDKWYSLLL